MKQVIAFILFAIGFFILIGEDDPFNNTEGYWTTFFAIKLVGVLLLVISYILQKDKKDDGTGETEQRHHS